MSPAKKGRKPNKRYRSPDDLETWEDQLDEYLDSLNIPLQIKKNIEKDLKQALKARYKEKTEISFQPTEEEYEEMPGALGIGITLDPRDWKKKGVWEVIKDTGKSWIESVFSWDDLSVMVEREEIWQPILRGSKGFPSALAIFERDPVTGKWRARGHGSLQVSLKKLGEDILGWASFSKSSGDRIGKFAKVQEDWLNALFEAGRAHSGGAFLSHPAVQPLANLRARYQALNDRLKGAGGAPGLEDQLKDAERQLFRGDLRQLRDATRINNEITRIKSEMDRLLWQSWREAQKRRQDLRGLIAPEMRSLFGLQDLLMFRENQHLFRELISNIESKSVIRNYLWLTTIINRYLPFVPAGIASKVRYVTPSWWVGTALKKTNYLGLSGTWSKGIGFKNFAFVEFKPAWDGLRKISAERFKSAWGALKKIEKHFSALISDEDLRAQAINHLFATQPYPVLQRMAPFFGVSQAEWDRFLREVIPELQRLGIPPDEWYNFLKTLQGKSLEDLRMGFLTFAGRYLDMLQKKLFALLKRKAPWLLKGIRVWQGGFASWAGSASSWMRSLAPKLASKGLKTLAKALVATADALASFVATPVGSAIIAGVSAVVSWLFEKTVKWVWRGLRGESDDSDAVRGCLLFGCGCGIFAIVMPLFIVVFVIASAFFDFKNPLLPGSRGGSSPATSQTGSSDSNLLQVSKSVSPAKLNNGDLATISYTVTISAPTEEISHLKVTDIYTKYGGATTGTVDPASLFTLSGINLASDGTVGGIADTISPGGSLTISYTMTVASDNPAELYDILLSNQVVASGEGASGDSVQAWDTANLTIGVAPEGLPPNKNPASGCIPAGGRFADPRPGGRSHAGLDIANSDGTHVFSPFPGTATVVAVGYHTALGYYITIKSGDYTVTFGHLLEEGRFYGRAGQPRLSIGDRVDPYEWIGLMDDTGTSSTGPHLHYEIEYQGENVDPEGFVSGIPNC